MKVASLCEVCLYLFQCFFFCIQCLTQHDLSNLLPCSVLFILQELSCSCLKVNLVTYCIPGIAGSQLIVYSICLSSIYLRKEEKLCVNLITYFLTALLVDALLSFQASNQLSSRFCIHIVLFSFNILMCSCSITNHHPDFNLIIIGD